MQPKYQLIKDEIKSWLINDHYSPHDKLPTETQLVEKFNVSRHTIRRAIGDLEVENYLYRIQGGGIFVADWKEKHSTKTPTKTIGVLTTHIADYIFPNIIVGIEKVLSDYSYSILLASTHNDISIERKSLENLLNKPIEGLIVEPTKSAYPSQNIGFYKNLENLKIPYLMINSTYQDIDAPLLALDDCAGGKLATEYLLSIGHQNILGIFKADDQQGVDRMKGFISAYQERHTLSIPGQFITYYTNDEKKELLKRLKAILTKSDRPTAIVCYNDQIALLVNSIAKKLGLRIPDDLSLIGFDDSSLSHMFDFQLTTIKHPKEQMGIDAANMILTLIESPPVQPIQSIIYKPELIIRESTKPV